uniref:Uncharacterized protein n=1 Tax=viral metagenome TaxID=1070528 RepID=A0A6M3JYE3_9ZZZZ
MENNKKVIMPFGKYAGEYVEDILYGSDSGKDYFKFLLNQEWFEKKYKGLYRVVKKLVEDED